MDFGIGGLFGAAGSIGGAAIAADAQKYAANTNWAIALTNYYARERERWEAKMEASRKEGEAKLGSTDAEGTQVKFVPGKGWVTTLSPENEALQGRLKAEQMARLGPDAQQQRYQKERNTLRQIREEDKAKSLFEEMRKTPDKKASQIEGLLNDAALTGIDTGFDDTSAIASRQAMRTKTPHGGAILAEIAKKRGAAISDAMVNSRKQAATITPELNSADDKVKANLYNMFATRAGAMPGESQVPQQIGSDNSLLAAMKLGAATNDNSFKAASMEGGRLPFVPPNYGMANAVGASGAALRGLFNNDRSDFGYFDDRDRERGNQGVL